jgi:hypothetical protein
MTKSRRNPPCQKALPFAKWPKGDRETWRAAHGTAGVLDDGGMASHLSPRTLDDMTSRYSYLLYFLAERGKLNHDGPAAASVTEENILDYVRFLESRVSSVTLAMSLRKIARVAACSPPNETGGGCGASFDGSGCGRGPATGALRSWRSRSCFGLVCS